VYVVAEAGVTAFGDPELAHRQVDAAADAGADAVKFQAWRTESLVSRSAAAAAAGDLGDDWFERLRSRELSFDVLRELQAHAAERGIPFFATPHDSDALRFLDELDVPLLKVGSGEAANYSFLREVGSLGRPVLIAFGLQADEEALRAVETLRQAGAPEVVALHTTSVYPTPPHLVGLERMARLRELLGVPVGLSDHSVGWHVPLAAVALGARAIEKHLTFDKRDPRSLDNPGALEPDELVEMVRQVREVEAALAAPAERELAAALDASRGWAEQAVVAARRLEAGTVLGPDDLTAKRPGLGGIPASELESLFGQTLRRAVEADEQIRREDLAAPLAGTGDISDEA
jgi:N,N'-diacetyllegionaminate synthase